MLAMAFGVLVLTFQCMCLLWSPLYKCKNWGRGTSLWSHCQPVTMLGSEHFSGFLICSPEFTELRSGLPPPLLGHS